MSSLRVCCGSNSRQPSLISWRRRRSNSLGPVGVARAAGTASGERGTSDALFTNIQRRARFLTMGGADSSGIRARHASLVCEIIKMAGTAAGISGRRDTQGQPRDRHHHQPFIHRHILQRWDYSHHFLQRWSRTRRASQSRGDLLLHRHRHRRPRVCRGRAGSERFDELLDGDVGFANDGVRDSAVQFRM